MLSEYKLPSGAASFEGRADAFGTKEYVLPFSRKNVDAALKEALIELAKLEAENKALKDANAWISVEDRLPDDRYDQLLCGIKQTPASEPCIGSVYFSDDDQCRVCDTCDFCENDNQGN